MDQGCLGPLPVRLGPYVVEEPVVASAFSRVYRAREDGLGRLVAIKVFHLEAEKAARLPYTPEDWQRRFIAEARLLGRLDHPHVVRVDGLGRTGDGRPYMVMPWHPANLRREIGRDSDDAQAVAALPPGERPRPLPVPRVRRVLRQACLGLAHLHARGVVHRDVKPTNLLLTAREEGEVRLCDLGMALLPGEAAAERAGVWIGTAAYCAPEQRRDARSVTDRADIYSVGVLAYRLLTGRLPGKEAPPPSVVVPGLPAEYDRLVDAAMAPLPANRPTAVALAAALA